MKKSLSDLAGKTVDTTSTEEAPKTKSFGAFKQINGTQAVIDLDVLRKYNIFFLKLN